LRGNPRSAKRNIVPPSGGFHSRADRVHNDLWLIDDHNMTGLFGNDLTSAVRKRDVITLQLAPCRIGALRTGHDHHRNRELPARSPDFRRARAFLSGTALLKILPVDAGIVKDVLPD